MRNRRYTHQRGIFGSAGWLFADLLLALTIIFIAMSAIRTPDLKAKPAPLAPTPTAIPTSTPIPAPHIQALDPKPLVLTIQSDPASLNQTGTKGGIIKQITRLIQNSHDSNRKVGFVITLGGGDNGVANAESFNAILKTMAPFKKAVFKNYHDLNNSPEEFDLEVYFLE